MISGLRGEFTTSKSPEMYTFINELKSAIGKEFPELSSPGSSAGVYSGSPLSESQLRDFKLAPNKNMYTLEEAIQTKIGEGFKEF